MPSKVRRKQLELSFKSFHESNGEVLFIQHKIKNERGKILNGGGN